jgi:hypothetical protein
MVWQYSIPKHDDLPFFLRYTLFREVWRDYVPPRILFLWPLAAASPPQVATKRDFGEQSLPEPHYMHRQI